MDGRLNRHTGLGDSVVIAVLDWCRTIAFHLPQPTNLVTPSPIRWAMAFTSVRSDPHKCGTIRSMPPAAAN